MPALQLHIDKQLDQDGQVMSIALERMGDLSHVMAAVWRLGADGNFNRWIAELAQARRHRNQADESQASREIMWAVETEILEQVRREIESQPTGGIH